jgi:hypothetical protein
MIRTRVEPERTLFLHDDREVVVRYDADKGEREWFDHKAGVGGPGCNPSVTINEIDLGDGFVDFDTCGLSERIRNGLHEQLMNRLCDDGAEEEADQAEAEYESWKEQGALE